MASFKKEIKNIYGVETYEDTKNTYDWIDKALRKGGFQALEIDSDFLFDVSDITCSCNGILEFVENAYGQVGYRFISCHLFVKSEDTRIAFISVDAFDRITITTDSKVMLERIIKLVENTSLDKFEVNDPISITYVETQINNDGVIVQGKDNIVANNHSEAEIREGKEESGFKKFWAGVLQNVASNFIWYLLTLIAGGLLTYFLSNL